MKEDDKGGAIGLKVISLGHVSRMTREDLCGEGTRAQELIAHFLVNNKHGSSSDVRQVTTNQDITLRRGELREQHQRMTPTSTEYWT
jgi:hypothetical protein